MLPQAKAQAIESPTLVVCFASKAGQAYYQKTELFLKEKISNQQPEAWGWLLVKAAWELFCITCSLLVLPVAGSFEGLLTGGDGTWEASADLFDF